MLIVLELTVIAFGWYMCLTGIKIIRVRRMLGARFILEAIFFTMTLLFSATGEYKGIGLFENAPNGIFSIGIAPTLLLATLFRYKERVTVVEVLHLKLVIAIIRNREFRIIALLGALIPTLVLTYRFVVVYLGL